MADEKKEEPKAEKPKGIPVGCGHENKHYVAPVEGERLFCTLPKGHEGDHQCGYKNDGKESIAYWNDAAGTPVKK